MKSAHHLMIQTPPIFVDRIEAAAALGISVSSFEGLVREGDVPPGRKISAGRVGWLWSDLLKFAESRPVSDLKPGPGRKPPGAQKAG